ncbi:expressed unknown protein [Seminavis robusta]|uniref:Uncharacterized protein n=1 Tax=Seminavis robusta TaxID=568900 RepID=A0A9N8DXV6_9STRA|nr:expressed unknown protein [Seminavis robusta]|eukprot:Sro431_g141540.1 n/a (120) ;mRNA; f:57246-57605
MEDEEPVYTHGGEGVSPLVVSFNNTHARIQKKNQTGHDMTMTSPVVDNTTEIQGSSSTMTDESNGSRPIQEHNNKSDNNSHGQFQWHSQKRKFTTENPQQDHKTFEQQPARNALISMPV